MAKVYKRNKRDILAGADVLIAGLFSAKQKDYEAVMDATAALVTAAGARVVGRVTQRRGVSDGGAALMGRPLSRQTLLRGGKIREMAKSCQDAQIDAVILVNAITEHQRRTLEERLGCVVLSRTELDQP